MSWKQFNSILTHFFFVALKDYSVTAEDRDSKSKWPLQKEHVALGSLGCLASDTSSIGEKIDLGDGIGCYQTGASSSAVIILFPDMGLGFGRTRLLADEFGRLGYRVYVPKLLQPALEGGTDGDGLPPSFDMGSVEDFMPWVVQIPWNTIEQSAKLMSYAKEQGAKSFGTIGCCWAGWATFHICDGVDISLA